MEQNFKFVPKEEITAEHFEEALGRPPVQDDLERSNCPYAGIDGHRDCGWNHKANGPVFMYGQDPRSFRLQAKRTLADVVVSVPPSALAIEGRCTITFIKQRPESGKASQLALDMERFALDFNSGENV